MVKKKSSEDISGSTFADLYDVQEEFNRRGVRPLGRPKNKVKRNPTTVYLTKEEITMLRRLQMTFSEELSSVNRSQIIGIAIELLTDIVATHGDEVLLSDLSGIDGLRRRLKNSV